MYKCIPQQFPFSLVNLFKAKAVETFKLSMCSFYGKLELLGDAYNHMKKKKKKSFCPGNFSVTFCSVESYFLHHAKQNGPNCSGSLQQFGKMFVIYHVHFFY